MGWVSRGISVISVIRVIGVISVIRGARGLTSWQLFMDRLLRNGEVRELGLLCAFVCVCECECVCVCVRARARARVCVRE